jgi:hypothetical protein
MKKTLVAAVVCGLFAVGSANAATTSWGDHDTVEIGTATLSGSFSEIFTFTLTAPTTSLSSKAVALDISPILNLSEDSMVWLYKETGATDKFLSAYSFGTLFTAHDLLAGDYYYKVTGSTTGSFGGAFALTSTTAPVAVVPEADTYAMMLAGLGMIGLMAKRRMG